MVWIGTEPISIICSVQSHDGRLSTITYHTNREILIPPYGVVNIINVYIISGSGVVSIITKVNHSFVLPALCDSWISCLSGHTQRIWKMRMMVAELFCWCVPRYWCEHTIRCCAYGQIRVLREDVSVYKPNNFHCICIV